MNKRGEDKIISIYWFFILIIVSTGIYAMVSIFYNSPYDVREMESEILAEKVGECLVSGGEFNFYLINEEGTIFKEEFKDHFLERCSLNFEAEKDWEEPQYFISVSFTPYSKNMREPIFEISSGNPNWESDCSLKDEKYEKLVTCTEKSFYGVHKSGKIYLIKITSMVRKSEKNVK